jgi:hypothetical protein
MHLVRSEDLPWTFVATFMVSGHGEAVGVRQHPQPPARNRRGDGGRDFLNDVRAPKKREAQRAQGSSEAPSAGTVPWGRSV